MCAFPAYGAKAAITSRNIGDSSSTNEINRATARDSPSRARPTNSPTGGVRRTITAPPAHKGRWSGRWVGSVWWVGRGVGLASVLGDSDDQGVALAAAAAEGGCSGPAAAAA
ncbi:hypothetical protein GCM10009630_59500 [Kribbella jejuensis]